MENPHRQLRMIMDTCTALRSLRESFPNLVGRFHAHLTVRVDPENIEGLRAVCQDRRVKLTIIDLENTEGRQQTDVMTTSYFLDKSHAAVTRIVDHLIELADALDASGYSVIRAKLEHESTPSVETYSREQYHEVHIKLRIPTPEFDAARIRLGELGSELGFVPSRNPLERRPEFTTQFVNLRIYEGDLSSADGRVAAIVQRVGDEFEVIEVKRETTLFDTHQALDQWWM